MINFIGLAVQLHKMLIASRSAQMMEVVGQMRMKILQLQLHLGHQHQTFIGGTNLYGLNVKMTLLPMFINNHLIQPH